jgi:transglutaminase-like putative cysteine protease
MRTSPSVSHPTTAPVAPIWQRLFPEGIAVFVLLMLVNVIPAIGMKRSGWEHLVIPIGLVSVLGYVAGWASARGAVLDTMAHLLAVGTGALVSAYFVARSVDGLEGSAPSRMRQVFTLAGDWYLGVGNSRAYEDIVLSLLLGLIVWMIGYLSAWVLFRRGWLAMALLQPLLLLLVNLGFAPDPPAVFTIAFCAMAIPLAARFHLFRKQQAWARFQQGSSGMLAFRFLAIGTVIGLLVTSAGWNTPVSVSQELLKPIMGEMGQQVESARDRAAEFIDERVGSPGSSDNTFSEFEEDFSIGGDASGLSDQPEVLVEADSAPYLAAQRYNVYDGRGWSTDLESTFNGDGPDGVDYAPKMAFRAGQTVTLSPVAGGEQTIQALITPLVTQGARLLTVDTFVSANVDSSVQMSWIQLDNAEFDIGAGSLAQVPPDLMQIAQLLRSLSLTGEDDGFGPLTGDTRTDEEVVALRRSLAGRFLDVRWVADDNGAATRLIVNGQIPVYDDVETVFPGQDIANDYSVRGIMSAADEKDLRAAGTSYPEWVTARYLDLPDTVTDRTREYAQQFATEGASTYDIAKGIEQHLRSTITYDLTVGSPPGDDDVVDYVLFEDQRGYCEHYATAMVVLLRALDIPARVVAGYAPGEWDEAQGGYVYLQQDAHLWVEVYFPEFGWIPFEPTANRAERVLGEETSQAGPEDGVAPTPDASATEDAESEPLPTPTEDAATPPALDQQDATLATVADADGGPGPGTIAAILGIVGAIAVAGVVVWWLWMRQLRGLDPVGALYVRLVRFGRLVGVSRRPTTTPKEFGDALAAKVPAVRQQTYRIINAYEIDQYGEIKPGGPVIEAATDAWRRIRARAAGSVITRLRWRRRNRG